MAEATAGGKSAFAFLAKKAGPLPIGVWLVALLGLWWYFNHKSAGSGSGSQTDPAGNTGVINPQTGYVYGSPEDKAALAANDATTTDTTTTNNGTVAGSYTDNAAWSRAAVNYLVGLGLDPAQANEAVQQYLSSQQLTTAQQADVNLAIQGIGPPPDLPGPVGTAPKPVVNPPPSNPPPKKTVYASNPPKGFHIGKRTKNSVGLGWSKAANATSYTVAYGTKRGSQQYKHSVPGNQTSITIHNLKPNTAYYWEVWANPTKKGGPHAGPLLGHTTK